MKVELKSLFPTPLIKFKFRKHYLYNFPEIPKSVNKPKEWIKPLNTSFENNLGDDFFPIEKKYKLIEDLKTDIKVVFEMLEIPTKFDIQELWYNVYHDNQGQETHDHLCPLGNLISYWSGVYYNNTNIPTVFDRPYNIHKVSIHPDYLNPGSQLNKFYCDKTYQEIEPGDVVLFPPWLSHSVEVGDECKDNMRLTFSFNLEYIGN